MDASGLTYQAVQARPVVATPQLYALVLQAVVLLS